MPGDFLELRRVWRRGELCRDWSWRGAELLVPDAGETVELEYARMPATVDAATSPEQPFEIAPDAAEAMPFFVAAQILASDLIQDSSVLMGLYRTMVEDLSAAQTIVPGKVRNVLYPQR